MADEKQTTTEWPPKYQVAFWCLASSMIVFCVIVLFGLDRLNANVAQTRSILTWQQGKDDERHGEVMRRLNALEQRTDE